METAVSKRKAAELEKLFQVASRSTGNHARINVNSVITEEEDKKYNDKSKDREEKLEELKNKDKEGRLNEKPKDSQENRPDSEL